ncbi:MAG: hypothetical protein IMZ50_09125 [Candidatus Atribacteria bacterium]|nr:hypothetical protein [Candidatus Atribacteria bacterium]
MRQRRSILGTTVFAMVVACAMQAMAQGKQEEQDQLLKMSQVPPKVQQAIQQYATASEIKQITKGDVDGTIAYEFQIEKGGRKSEVSITPDGRFLASEEEMPLSEFPDPARKLIDAQAAGGRVVSTKKILEDGKTVFAAIIEKAGKQEEITVTPDGKVIDTEAIKR